MDPSPALRLALDNAHQAFADYPRPKTIEASPYKDAAKVQALLSAPAGAESLDAMIYYSYCAMTTIGGVEDYKYFLPILLELAVASGLFEPDMIANKLLYGHWREWPPQEVDAISDLFRAALTQAVAEHPDEYVAEPWFFSAARLGLDVDVLMRIWESGPMPNAMLQLTDLYDPTSLFRSKLNGRWLEIDGDVVRALRTWLLSDDIGGRLILAATLATDRDIAMLDTALMIRDAVAHEFR